MRDYPIDYDSIIVTKYDTTETTAGTMPRPQDIGSIRSQWPLLPDTAEPYTYEEFQLRLVLKKIYRMYDNPELVRICADALNGRFEEALR